MRGIFLNPLPARRRRTAKKRKVVKKAKRKVAKKMTRWQRLVKKHGGNMKAARREYSGQSASGTRSTSRKRSAGARKRRKSTAKRKVAPVAKRKRRTATRKRKARKSRARKPATRRRKPAARKKRRRRAVIAPSVTWRRAVRRKTGKRVKARTTRKRALAKWKRGVRKGIRGKGTKSWRRAVRRGVAKVNPRRRRRVYRRRRNPMPISISGVKSAVKGLVAKSAVKDYLYVTAGFVAGGILPAFVSRGLYKIGILKSAPTQMINVGIGLGSAVIAGLGAGMITKRKDVGVKVAGGAVAGVLGALVLREIEKRGWFGASSMSGLGASDDAVRRGIEAEIRRASGVSGGGVGEFLTEQRLSRELSGGMGSFVSQEMAEDAPLVSGLGAVVTDDIEEGTDTFDGGAF